MWLKNPENKLEMFIRFYCGIVQNKYTNAEIDQIKKSPSWAVTSWSTTWAPSLEYCDASFHVLSSGAGRNFVQKLLNVSLQDVYVNI